MMEPSTLAPRAPKPPKWWAVVTAVAGAVGALSAIAAAGTGTYDVAPFRVELRAWPAAQGKTEFAVEQVGSLPAGRAEAGTHRSPIVFRAKIIGLASEITPSDLLDVRTPRGLAEKLAQDGKDAARAFGFKLGLLAVAGALAGGVACSLFGMRLRRLVGALLAGVLTFGVIGLLVQQTYDKGEFAKTRFVRESGTSPNPSDPTLPSP